MYCPVCFNHSLALSTQGVIQVVINGRQRDSGRFLFSLALKERNKILPAFKDKAEEFFQWYSEFVNKKPIQKVELLTPDMKCENSCRLPSQTYFSIIDLIIPQTEVTQTIEDLGLKYDIKVKLKT